MIDETGELTLRDDLAASVREFTGRAWLFERINAWLDQKNESRFLIVGRPGTGKSAVAARLVQLSQGENPSEQYPRLGSGAVTYAHFCRALDPSVLDPLRFVEALAKRLAQCSSAYAVALTQLGEQKIEINASQAIVTAESGADVTVVRIESLRIGELSAELAFERVVRTPLAALSDTGLNAPILVLVDALDEALTLRSSETLVTLIRGVLTTASPKLFRFILTSRADPRVLNELGEPTLDIDRDGPAELNEVREYAHRRLKGLVEPKRGMVADNVASAAKGNFLYARYVVDDLLAHPNDDDANAFTFPEGLDGHYRMFLGRELGRTGETWRDRYRPVLGTLAVARSEGLTMAQLSVITGLKKSKTDDALKDCAQFLAGPSSNGEFRIYHQSFREFLLNDSTYTIYPQEVNAAIAEYFMRTYGGNWAACNDDYALAFTVTHLLEALRDADDSSARAIRDQLISLLTNVECTEAKARQLGVDAVLADLAISLNESTLDESTAQFARVLEREAHHLRTWNAAVQPAFFAQQVLNRAKVLGFDEHALACAERLERLSAPHLRLRWWATRQSPELERILGGHSDVVGGVAVTADARWLVSGSWDGSLKIWNMETGRELRSVSAHFGGVGALVITPDGRKIVSGSSDDGKVKVWDIESGRELSSMDAHTDWISALTLTPEGRKVIAGFSDGVVQIWDLETRENVSSFQAHDDWINAIAIGSGRILTGSSDGTVKAWALNGKPIGIHSYDCAINAIAITSNGNFIVGKDDYTVALCDFEDGRELLSFSVERDPSVIVDEGGGISALVLTEDGRQVFVSHDFEISQWDLATRKCVRTLVGHEPGADREICCLAVTPDGRRLISGAGDFMVIVWDLQTLGVKRISQGHRRRVEAITTADRDRAVSVSEDLEFRFWDIQSGDLMNLFDATADEHGWVDGVAIAHDLRSAVSLGESAAIWDLVRMKRLGEIRLPIAGRSYLSSRVGYEGGLNSVAITPDGRRIAVAYYPSTGLVVDVLDFPSLDFQLAIRGPDDSAFSAMRPLRLNSVAFAPDHPELVFGQLDGQLEFIKLDTRESLVFAGHANRVTSIAMSPSGLTAVSGADDGTIKLWDTKVSSELRAVPGRPSPVRALGFTPDGQKVVALFDDGVLKVMDARTLDETLDMPAESAELFSVSSSVVRHAVTWEQDGTAQVWDLQIGRQITALPATDGGFTVEAIDINGRCAILNRGGGELAIWNFAEGRVVHTFEHTGHVTAVVITPDGRRCVSGDEDGAVMLWELETGRKLKVIDDGSGDGVTAASVDDADCVAWGTKGGSVYVSNLGTEETSILTGLGGAVTALEFRRWGGLIVTRLPHPPAAPGTSRPCLVQVWDLSRTEDELGQSRELEIFYQPEPSENRESRVLLTTFAPDGERLLCIWAHRGLDIWKVGTKENQKLDWGGGDAIAAQFSSDGRSVVLGTAEGQVRIIDLQTDRALLDVGAGEGAVLAVSFTPDGRRAVTGSYDRGVRVWDVESGRLLITAKMEGAIESVTVASDGVTVLAGDRLGNVSCLVLS